MNERRSPVTVAQASKQPKVLVIRGSISSKGGAERELIKSMIAWSNYMELRFASLDITSEIRSKLSGKIMCLQNPVSDEWPKGTISEITAAVSRFSEKAWLQIFEQNAEENDSLANAIGWCDVIHISSGNGSLEILPIIPENKPIHYHCLEPPRGLYENTLHLGLDGKKKRNLSLTKLVLSNQRRRHERLFNQLRTRKNVLISGNSRYTQRRIEEIYGLEQGVSLENGQPCQRNNDGTPISSTLLWHAIDLNEWAMPKNVEDKMEPYAITIGRACYAKGTLESLESLQGTGLELTLVGSISHDDRMMLAEVSKKNNVVLKILSETTDEEISDLISNATAVISHAHGEPFGLTPLEAMACGTPALFVNDGGFRDTIVDDVNGRLLPRDDIDAWKNAIEQAKLLVNRKRWSEVGRERIEAMFTFEVQAKALLNLIEDLKSN